MRILQSTLLLLLCMTSTHATTLREMDASNVEQWADTEFGLALSEKRYTGAAVTVVKDGALLLSKGYGYADYATQTPMDPARTPTRICSVSKVIVATALMQLVDRGLIASLEDPANKYLKRIQLPDFEGPPITLRNLTTHRGGFEDSFFGAGTLVRQQTPLDARTIEHLLPHIVRKPGSLSVYSNATAALQGVIIEDVSGMPLAEYLAKNIFAPLGMTNTQLNDGPPAPAGHAQPYVLYTGGSMRAVPVVAKSPLYAASGGVYSTAEDMSRFAIAHLDAGRTASNPILSPAAFETMHTPVTRNHPALGSIGVQFYVDDLNGTRVVSHGCGLPGFTSYLVLIPESNVGVFVNVVSAREAASLSNCCGRPGEAIPPNFAVKFYYSFLREYIGFGELPAGEPPVTDPAPYVGAYRPERRAYTTMLAALDLLDAKQTTIVIREITDGALQIGEHGPYRAYRTGVLQRDTHPGRIYAFDFGADGRATRMMWTNAQSAVRLGFWDNPVNARNVLVAHTSLCLTGLLAFFWPASRRTERLARYLPAMTLVGMAIAFAAAKLGFLPGESLDDAVNVEATGRLVVILIACNLVALAAIAINAIAVRGWIGTYWGGGVRGALRRVHFSLLALSSLACIIVLATFRLLGVQLP